MNFSDIANLLSTHSLIAFAKMGKTHRAAIAKSVLARRVARGDVDDMDFQSALDLGLISQ